MNTFLQKILIPQAVNQRLISQIFCSSQPAYCFNQTNQETQQTVNETNRKDMLFEQFNMLHQQTNDQMNNESEAESSKPRLRIDQNLNIFKYVNARVQEDQQASEKNEQKNIGISEQIKAQDPQLKTESVQESVNQNTTNFKQQINEKIKEIRSQSAQGSVKSVLSYCQDAWKETFPQENEKTIKRMDNSKKRAKEIKEVQMRLQSLSEQELEKLQESIPNWKRTSLEVVKEKIEKVSFSSQIKNILSEKIQKTEVAKQIQNSEEYKEYQNFKKEIVQFRSDLKDHLYNSESPVVRTSLHLINSCSTESTVCKAINKMKLLDPEFDLWELEQDANIIFKQAYETFLRGEKEELEQICNESALGYFQVLLKKREFDKSQPQYQELWQVQRAIFEDASVTENGSPIFIFSISIQEIHCHINPNNKKIVDGGDDRIMKIDYNFALRHYQSPIIDELGHNWELVEIQPKQSIKLLV